MKKSYKTFLAALGMIAAISVTTGCGTNNAPDAGGNTTPDTGDTGGGNSETVVEKYDVTFYDGTTKLSTSKKEEGSKVNKPSDPTKSGYIFVGWYSDANFTTEQTFPITVGKSNVNVYAKFITTKQAFLNARNNTVGKDSKGFEYNYTVHLQAKYGNITQALNGNQVGKALYNNSQDETKVNFYDEHVNSGSLFYDGSLYQAKTSTKLQKIRTNQDGKVTSIKNENVAKDYKYGSSTFAKPLFEYDENQIKSVNATSNGDYEIKTSANASKIISIIVGNIDNPILGKLLGVDIPETDTTFKTFVKFDKDYLKSYKYEFGINVSKVQLTLTYDLTFTHKNEAVTITPKTFEEAHLKGTQLFNDDVTKANAAFTKFHAKELSGYHVVVKSGVDYGFTSNEINSTFNVNAIHLNKGGAYDYDNKIEVDSDFKNADLYKEANINDLTYYRGTLANDEVWDARWQLVGTKDEQKVATPREIDKNLFVPDNLSINEFVSAKSFSFSSKETKNEITTYNFGLEDSGALDIINYVNEAALLTPYGTKDVKIFGSFDASSVVFKKINYSVSVNAAGELMNVECTLKGEFKTLFEGSRDFTTLNESVFDLSLKLETEEVAKYEVPTKAKDLKF